MTIRVAAGTAIHLGLRKGRTSAYPTTAHFLTPGKCIYDCAYCTKAKSSTSHPDFMCRITWPAFHEPEVWAALEEDAALARACIQVVNRPGCFSTARNWVREIRSRCDIPVSVEVRAERSEIISDVLREGADCVGLPLDVASETLYPNLRGGILEKELELILSSAVEFPGKISTHIIVGLGETDKEVIDVSRRILRTGVPLALFAFTPCKGTRLQTSKPPSLDRYRRIQVATHLISEDPATEFEYDREGNLSLPSLKEDELREIADRAFLTRGCEGCNRPFYNERPGCTPYNYPKRLTEEQVAEEMRVLG
jgi:biotin synthase